MAVKVFLLLILFYGILSLTQSVNPGECYGRWIYIRNFTSCFNVDLLAHYSNDPIYHDFCPYITNRALGPRTFNGSHSVAEEIQTHDLRICRRSPVHHQLTVHGLIFNNSTLYLFKKDTISCAIIVWCACDLQFTFQGYPLY
ncbi:hypothetical protein AAC387_Pa03g3987 [Persea americana]